MRIQKLIIQSFKGIESLAVEPEGQSLNVYGQNASGKTSIVDAVSWLLIDKDTQDKSPLNFGIKPVDAAGEVVPGMEPTVEAVFSLQDGGQLRLKKVYQEKWVTKRGNGQSQLDGHKTDYYWNEEPVKQSDYNERIEEIMSAQMFKVLTLPNYFAETMHWKDRRQVLSLLCGDITDQDIIADNPALDGYTELLDGRTQEAMIKILRDRKKKLNDEIDNIPSRIDENNQKIVSMEIMPEEAQASIEELTGKIEAKSEELSRVNAGGGVSELQVKIQQIEAEKAKARNDHRNKVDESLKVARVKVAGIESKVDESEKEFREASRAYIQTKSEVEDAEEKATQIVSDIESKQQIQPDPKKESAGPEVCPICDQEVPEKEDHVGQYDKYVSDFNEKKATRLKELKAHFDEAQKMVTNLTADLKQRAAGGEKARAKNVQRKAALEKAKAELQSQKDGVPEFSTEVFDSKQAALQKKIDEIRLSKKQEVDRINSEIADLQSKAEDFRKILRQYEFNGQLRARNKELQDMLKKYAQELDETEKALYLIEEFNKAKAHYITDKVNDLFDIVEWRLFKDQVNDGITETCEPMVGGVPYSEGLNTAARIQAGVDIIKTLSSFYGKSAPILLDGRESVTELPETDLQIISLFVSPKDKVLRIEQEEKEMAVA